MHPIVASQLIMMVEEDLDRIRRGEDPWISYIWNPPQLTTLPSKGSHQVAPPPKTWNPPSFPAP